MFKQLTGTVRWLDAAIWLFVIEFSAWTMKVVFTAPSTYFYQSPSIEGAIRQNVEHLYWLLLTLWVIGPALDIFCGIFFKIFRRDPWIKAKILSSLGLIISIPLFSAGTNYYVDNSPTGCGGAGCVDTNAGTSLATAWLTIDKCDDTATAGDTCYINGGTDYNESYNETPDSSIASLKPSGNGTAGNPITFTNVSGTAVVIDNNDAGPCFYLSDKDYFTFQVNAGGGSFTLNDCQIAGIRTVTGSTNIIVDGLTITNIDGPGGENVGAFFPEDCDDCIIRNSTITTVRVNGVDNQNAAGVMNFDATNLLVEDNTISDMFVAVFDKRSSSNSVNGTTVKGNEIFNITYAHRPSIAASGNQGHYNVKFYNNLVYDLTGKAGLIAECIYASPTSTTNNSINYYIVNNTCIGAGFAFQLTSATFENVRMCNNICYDCDGGGETGYIVTFNPETELKYIDYNLVWNPSGGADDVDIHFGVYSGTTKNYTSWATWKTAPESDHQDLNTSNPDANGVNADPLFTSVASDDYTLQGSSPALGAGINGEDLGYTGTPTADTETCTAAVAETTNVLEDLIKDAIEAGFTPTI